MKIFSSNRWCNGKRAENNMITKNYASQCKLVQTCAIWCKLEDLLLVYQFTARFLREKNCGQVMGVYIYQGETILNFLKKMKDPDPLMDAKSDSKTFL